MKLVLFNDNEEIIDVIPVEGLEIEEANENSEVNAVWDTGRIVGLKAKFAVLNDQDIEEDQEKRPARVTEQLKAKNKGNQFRKANVHSVEADLKRMEALENRPERPEQRGNNGQPN